MPKSKADTVAVRNINRPGKVSHLDARMYEAMKRAYLAVLPGSAPGLTLAEIRERLLPLLPQALYPSSDKAGWWAKTVQLDLEAKGVIERETATAAPQTSWLALGTWRVKRFLSVLR